MHLSFGKCAKASHQKKKKPFQQMLLEQLDKHTEKIHQDAPSHHKQKSI